PGRGAVVTFDSDGKAKVLVKGAETPQEFVEPIRKYLARNFGLDLRGTAAGCEGETPKQVGNSSEITDSVAPQPAKASEGKNRKLTSKLASISVKCADRFLGALTVICLLALKTALWIAMIGTLILTLANVMFGLFDIGERQSGQGSLQQEGICQGSSTSRESSGEEERRV